MTNEEMRKSAEDIIAHSTHDPEYPARRQALNVLTLLGKLDAAESGLTAAYMYGAKDYKDRLKAMEKAYQYMKVSRHLSGWMLGEALKKKCSAADKCRIKSWEYEKKAAELFHKAKGSE